MGCIWVLVFIFYMYPNKTYIPAKPDAHAMGVSFQYSMGMGTNMGVVFENGVWMWVSSTLLNSPHCYP